MILMFHASAYVFKSQCFSSVVVLIVVIIPVFLVSVAVISVAVVSVALSVPVVIKLGPAHSMVIAIPIGAGLDDIELPLNGLRCACHQLREEALELALRP
jgi:hypothetical protein